MRGYLLLIPSALLFVFFAVIQAPGMAALTFMISVMGACGVHSANQAHALNEKARRAREARAGVPKAMAKQPDIHTATVAEALGIAPEDVTPEQRNKAKKENFARVYGMDPFSPHPPSTPISDLTLPSDERRIEHVGSLLSTYMEAATGVSTKPSDHREFVRTLIKAARA